MKNMTLKAICEACHGELYANHSECAEIEVSQVVIDSRKIIKNGLFIATKGERVDGHDFIEDVYQKGALGVVCETAPYNKNIPYILVKDSFQALKDIASYYRMQLRCKVVGITGSVGKTSTKEFVASVLEQKYKVLKTLGNFNNEVGLPLTVLSIEEKHEIAVLEMGISDFGEMTRLSKIARPDICVLTNIGQCHLENLKTREGILQAKTEIFEFMSEEGSVCINGDDDMLTKIHEVKGKKPIRFGLSAENDVVASNIDNLGLFGSQCVISVNGEQISVHVPLPGEHMVINAACATAVGKLFSLTNEEIARGLETVKSVAGRSNIIRHKTYTIIDDCYNANPVSMKAAIDLLMLANTRKVAILGDMGELGANEVALHSEIGAYAMAKNVDLLVCVGELSKHMYDTAKQVRMDGVVYFPTLKELQRQIIDLLEPKDTILIKASHFMQFHELVEEIENKY